jgi:drug/metabolite transporter (DMT)-like permease
MHWTLYLLIANVGVAFTEYSYRGGKYATFLDALPVIALPTLVTQWALYNGFKGATSLFVAGAVFSLINVAFRVVNTYWLGESINWVNWVGIVFLVSATILLKWK